MSVFGVPARKQTQIVEQIGQAISEVAPAVREAVNEHPCFREIGKRMLLAWQEGLSMLYNKRTYNLGELDLGESFRRLSGPEPVNAQRVVIGRSGLADSDPMG
ncbi:hypothetical protein [Xanthomonas cucurbitae]|uniref:Uncharacterized protein n=1 Tax=Xanthomonas cucurbitae TaxID=56453 RepID=A0ABY7Y964_9XANT|nr:hypothetical protein [Xanthomonas cucurbitae]QHG87629.1 hypothetical protein EBN15_12480 [Xanthomonas cucurbitae]WDM70372.1 hypothetical protein K6978_13140 [Xanthomonas cucurbitae]WDM74245.1 hypothetical protein K6982_12500 [Xanthomonas cucurbitae]